jgi:hypothetical protein
VKVVMLVAPQVQGQSDHRPVQARLNKRIGRNQFPAGFDGDTLTLDSHSASGLKWRTGTNRLIHDLDPELSFDLDCNGNKVVELGTPTAGTDAVTKAYADALVLQRSYYMATKTVASTTSSMAGGGAEHWITPTSWTARQADEWSESSGEFSYAGAFPASGSRRFLVSYTASFQGSTNLLFWSMLARITKKPDGGSHAAVAGSSHRSSPYGWWAYFVYHQTHSLSCSSIVEIESGDVISFQYGNTVSNAGTPSITRATMGDGIVLTIIPADISP